MKVMDSPKDIERFRALILARLGLFFEDSKLGFLSEVIRQRIHETRLSAEDYLRLLEYDSKTTELPMLAKELTVPETYFFRNFDQFRVFRDMMIPAWRQKMPGRKMTVVSAGCASGEEPYSIAMIMISAGFTPGVTMSVHGIDINPAIIKKAKRARYSSWAFRETPAEQQKQWFQPDGRDLVVDDTVRRAVSFHEANLADDNPEIWSPRSIDVIFCRNVLMYFSPEQARKAIARMAQALVPGGYLFLGHAETLRGWSEDFHLRHTHNAFYYQLKEQGEAPSEPTSWPAVAVEGAAPPLSEDWMETIHKASERVHALSVDGPAQMAGKTPPVAPSAQPRAAPDMAPVFALMHGDRFGDALAYVRDITNKADRADPDVMLVEAMLLAHSGKTNDAEDLCAHLLQLDEMNASAHHVLALCREVAGDLEGALEQDRIAAYLDPAFAMPHLHMGLMERRRGNKPMARRELSQALPLLKHEDGARLLLFGGGFNRQSMIELCASALKDCGGSV